MVPLPTTSSARSRFSISFKQIDVSLQCGHAFRLGFRGLALGVHQPLAGRDEAVERDPALLVVGLLGVKSLPGRLDEIGEIRLLEFAGNLESQLCGRLEVSLYRFQVGAGCRDRL